MLDERVVVRALVSSVVLLEQAEGPASEYHVLPSCEKRR